MRKFYFTVVIPCMVLLFNACKSTKTTTQTIQAENETTILSDPEKARINRFVSMDAVSELRVGMTIPEVFSRLGAKPYNVLSAQADAHTVFQYKYRLVKMEVPAANANNFGIEKQNNKLLYATGEEDLYIVFSGAGKLEYMTTSQGGITEKLLRDNNLLFVIKRDKDKFMSDTSRLYRQTNSNPFYPMIPCSNCPEKKEEPKAKEEGNLFRIRMENGSKN